MADPNEVLLVLTNVESNSQKGLAFELSSTVKQVIVKAAELFGIPNVEAYGLCWPSDQKGKASKTKRDYRDAREWLAESKTLAQYDLRSNVSILN
jgi:hypothetical protein